MTQLTAHAWKEWREARAFLWIAFGVFIGLPIAGGIELVFQSHKFEMVSQPWVLVFGGVLAVFVAVGATCRDFQLHLDDFWRSRPISVTRWFLVKYLVGLAVVLVGCTLPLVLERVFNHDRSVLVQLNSIPFLWIALYSVGFLSGCLVRHTAHAAMLALAAMLLVYFLPMVVPRLEWLNAANVTIRNGNQIKFAGGMLALALACLAVALLSVHNSWHIESGRKMMYGSVSAALLILLSTAASQVGTNLPVLQQIDLPEDEGNVYYVELNGRQGFLIAARWVPQGPKNGSVLYTMHTLELTSTGIHLGSSNPLSTIRGGDRAARTVEHPEIGYEFDENPNDLNDKSFYVVVTELGNQINSVRLPWTFDRSDQYWSRTTTYAWKDRLYVIGDGSLLTLDISQPRSPRVIAHTPIGHRYNEPYFDVSEHIRLPLPQVPGLSAAQRLQARAQGSGYFNGQMLYVPSRETLYSYRLNNLTDKFASFDRIGRYDPTMLEQLFGFNGYGEVKLEGGLLYVSSGYVRRPFNPHVTVFDVRGPEPLRAIGHFAATSSGLIVRPLPDGRALIAGNKLWLVGPPPRRLAN